MEFEFDPVKSTANADKHGIDFVQAQRLWHDPSLLVAPARTQGEPRFIAIGRIDDRHWAAIVTLRAGVLRVISVRRARKEEIARYEDA